MFTVTVPFNNMQTLKLKIQLTNAFFPTVNQMFGDSFQLPTTIEHCFIVWTGLDDLITTRSAVVGSQEEPPNIWLKVEKTKLLVDLWILESTC